MQLSMLIARQIASMMLMLLTGFSAGRLRLLPEDAEKTVSALSLYILCPAILLSAFQMDFTREKLVLFLWGLAAALVINLLFIGASLLCSKAFGIDDVDRLSLIYVNSGNLIVPLIAAILGREFVFYSSSYLALMNTLFWIHGYPILSGDTRISLRQILVNPNLISICAGMLLFISQISLPGLVSTTIGRLADCIGPVSMLGIGIIMSRLPLARVFQNARAWLICILRLLFFPLLCIFLIWLFRPARLYPGLDNILLCSMLAAAAPSAVMISQLASITDRDTAVASAVNVLTTLLCTVTMPFMIMVYQILCMR